MAPLATMKAIMSTWQHKPPLTKPAPLTTEQQKYKREAHEHAKAAIDAKVDKWFSSTMAKAEELAERFSKKPCYFLDLFFHGSACLVHENSTNPWNAFMSKKADEANDGESLLRVLKW